MYNIKRFTGKTRNNKYFSENYNEEIIVEELPEFLCDPLDRCRISDRARRLEHFDELYRCCCDGDHVERSFWPFVHGLRVDADSILSVPVPFRYCLRDSRLHGDVAFWPSGRVADLADPGHAGAVRRSFLSFEGPSGVDAGGRAPFAAVVYF